MKYIFTSNNLTDLEEKARKLGIQYENDGKYVAVDLPGFDSIGAYFHEVYNLKNIIEFKLAPINFRHHFTEEEFDKIVAMATMGGNDFVARRSARSGFTFDYMFVAFHSEADAVMFRLAIGDDYLLKWN